MYKLYFSFIIGNTRLFADNLPEILPFVVKTALSILLKVFLQLISLRPTNGYQVSSDTQNIHDADDLWDRTYSQYLYTNVRTKLTIDWYGKNKEIKYVYRDGVLVAIGIYILSTPKEKKGCYITLVDFWYDFSVDLSSIIYALTKSDKTSLKQLRNVSSIRYPHFSRDISITLSKMGMLKHRYQHAGFLRPVKGMKSILTANNAYFTLLQGDFGA
jgi:hypothetical protein